MLFLKSIYAYGFKSFGEPTKIDFNHAMTGVVGPNGSGKSNITDAIRWALGEQSQKSLRGKKMDDIVFSGSSNKGAMDQAEVKLTFSNEEHTFTKIDSDIVEIKRTFNRKTRDSEFYINGEQVRLKDVQDVALETGLTKSSLAIISQGTISHFAEAKPEDRRELFNEAAGVAKYKKRKEEALTKLIKTSENLTRINDIVAEMNRSLPKLEEAAKKAELYNEKWSKLSDIEINILVKDGKAYTNRLNEVKETANDYQKKIDALKNEINLSYEQYQSLVDDQGSSDTKLADLNNHFNDILKSISELKDQLKEAESRNDTSDEEKDFKAKQLEKDYQSVSLKIDNENDKQYKLKEQLNQLKARYDDLDSRTNSIYQEIEDIRNLANKLEAKISYAENNVSNSQNYAVNQLMNNNIRGVVGPLISLIEVDQRFQDAISSVGYGKLNSVVMETSDDTKKAAEFVRKNRLGKVTFLPLDTLTANTYTGLRRQAIESSQGFVGFANELVKVEPQYDIAVDYVMGGLIVVDTYDNGQALSLKMGQSVNIVTLDGDRFLPHGAVVAGKSRSQANLFSNGTSSNEIDDLKQRITDLDAKEQDKTKEWQNSKIEKDKVADQISNMNVQLGTSVSTLDSLKANQADIDQQYEILTGHGFAKADASDTGNEVDRLNKKISKLEAERDDVQLQIQQINRGKADSSTKVAELAKVNKEKTDALDKLKDEASESYLEKQELENRLRQINDRLVERYEMTLDSALENYEVKEFDNEDEARKLLSELKNELKDLGNVDPDSIDKYKAEKERFDYFEKERKDIQGSVDELQGVIDQMDQQMISQFTNIIDEVNKVLPDSFSRLFGGGTATLSYSNPDDLLNTGVDITVNPPGKKVKNINLLSGGEKSLVALSVLFSILKVKPLPLVILDEAEAPLDPSNVERFAMYIREFTNHTQFIVVTHREGTMENCDVLYGVTMEHKGITKIVKIKLYDAKQMIAQEQQQADN